MSEAVTIADNGLTFQEEMFCREYFANGENGTAAAQAAGYGGTVNSSAVLASRKLRQPNVVAFLRELKNEYFRSKHMGPDAILYELATIAGFDLGTFMTEGMLDRSKLRGEATRVIQSIETSGRMTKVKTYDKLAATRLLMQHLGMIKEGNQTNVQVNIDFGERMAARRARALEGRDNG